MTEEDTVNMLRASRVTDSIFGGYYYFVPDYSIKFEGRPHDVLGKIYCTGAIYDIIKDKKKDGETFVDWLSGSWKQEFMMHPYVVACDNYARHIVTTYPKPGVYWTWTNETVS